MSWREEMHRELARALDAEQAGNAGRVRTCARRAIGIAITEWQRRDTAVRYGPDFLRQLMGLADDRATPVEVQNAATRLGAKLSEDFEARSKEPLQDARIVLRHILERMGESADPN